MSRVSKSLWNQLTLAFSLPFWNQMCHADVISSFIISANKLGAVVMGADSAEILSGTQVR